MIPYFDPSIANAARIYDCLLGGKDNFEADRIAAGELTAIAPDAPQAALDNRNFLGHAVRFLAGEAGISQFLDIGSGLPSMGNVHEIAQEKNRDTRIAYVDYDPVVISHAQNRLADEKNVIAIEGDLRQPEDIINSPMLKGTINFEQPVAVTLVAILHFLEDKDAHQAVRYLKDVMAPGSYLVISHATPDDARDGEAEQIVGVYKHASANLHIRTKDQISRFFEGLELVPPGVVAAGNWRSKSPAQRVVCYAGAAKKAGEPPD